MNNIKLLSIFAFVYITCIYYQLFFSGIFNPSFSIPRFSTSFKPINGYEWETSQINIILLIKLFGIYLLTSKMNISFSNLLMYIFTMEFILLTSINSSSMIIHPLILIIF